MYGTHFRSYIYDENGTEVGAYKWKGGDSYYYKLNPEINKTYYICMVQTFNDCRTSVTFRMTYTNEAPNKQADAAKYTLGTLVNDSTYTRTDQDWFVFKTPSYPAQYKFLANGMGETFYCGIYDRNETEICCYLDRKVDRYITLQPDQTYYVCFWLSSYSTEYTFRIDATPIKKLDKTGISSVKARKKAFVARITASDYAQGYEVKYATKKNMKKAKTVKVKGTVAKIKKLKSKTTYYVQVRAYAKGANGRKIYSPWSKKTKVWIK